MIVAPLKPIVITSDPFLKFVVCPSCHSIYNFDECFNIVAGKKVPKKCCKVSFPNHPYASYQKPCNHKLIAEVTLGGGKRCHYPLKVYCYSSLINNLTKLLLHACEHWRTRNIMEGIMEGCRETLNHFLLHLIA